MAQEHLTEESAIPVSQESVIGALIDSSRITAHTALLLLPAEPAIIELNDEPGLLEVLTQALSWLDAARLLTMIEAQTPPTSIHVVKS